MALLEVVSTEVYGRIQKRSMHDGQGYGLRHVSVCMLGAVLHLSVAVVFKSHLQSCFLAPPSPHPPFALLLQIMLYKLFPSFTKAASLHVGRMEHAAN